MELCQEWGSWVLGKVSAPEGGDHGTGCPVGMWGQWAWPQAAAVQETFGHCCQT